VADYSAVQRVTVAQIQAAVCEEWGCDLVDMLSGRRLRNLARTRHVGMYLTRELTYLSLPRIGEVFGKRDHTTVMYAVARITKLMATDPVFALRVTALEARLQPAELVEHF
jgi:chromosomal replication initiator protein